MVRARTNTKIKPSKQAKLRTDEAAQVRIANRLSLLEQSSKGETRGAWSKSKTADLQVVKPVKTTRYSDIDLNNWKAYEHVKTDTLWEFPTRLKDGGHSNEYHGNYIPQIAQQLYERFTKKNDIVLDLFFGSGTSGIEAVNMGRRCIGV